MRQGDVTAEAYATALLGRAERLQHLNAFRVLDHDIKRQPPAPALEAALGSDRGSLGESR